jgi:hypothetical protein
VLWQQSGSRASSRFFPLALSRNPCVVRNTKNCCDGEKKDIEILEQLTGFEDPPPEEGNVTQTAHFSEHLGLVQWSRPTRWGRNEGKRALGDLSTDGGQD